MTAQALPDFALDVRGVYKRFGGRKGEPEVHALADVSLQVPHGSLVALVGPDGAGKTTLLRLAAALMPADGGTLRVLGLDPATQSQQVQDRISYMPQRFGLYEDLTVQENLDLYADLHGVPLDERRRRYERLLHMTDLTQFTARLAGKLSGGMKQKLGLACTLVRSPELLLLDEPTVGVDPLSRRELWQIVQQLVQEEKLSVVISTSYLDEAERCEQVVVLHQGQVLAQGSPGELRLPAQGRVWMAKPRQGLPARLLQAQLMDLSATMDAVPQGGDVRWLRADRVDMERGVAGLPVVAVERVPERLEDAFMLMLRHKGDAGHVAKVVAGAPAESGVAPEQESFLNGVSAMEQLGEAGDSGPHVPQQTGSAVIEVHDLVRRFGDFVAVDHTTFEVHRGEIFGLLGPNGAGKTTTFRMLCGLLPASSGSLRVAGVDLRTARAEARRHVGYVAQKFSLYGDQTVRENLQFFGGAYRLFGAELRRRMAAVVEEFGLQAQLDQMAGKLPGGYKQRLAMAAALLHQPDILFLDEATSGADPLARRDFWRRITRLAQEGTTIVVTTHFMEEAEYCDRILIQDAGRMLALGTPRAVREQAAAGGAAVSDMDSAFIAIVEQRRREAGRQVEVAA